ncbi:MAG: GNAT family N-acetyltransferase [Candidatus Thorarchaeota archaeon]
MAQLKYISGSKKDIPKEYLQDLLIMIRDNSQERLPFEAFPIEFYQNYWFLQKLPEEEEIQILALDENNELIGFGYIGWNIKYDNLDKGFIQVYVKPEKRRQGYGREIVKHIIKLIPNQITTLLISALEGSEGEKFLKRFKSKWSFQEYINGVHLKEFNIDEVSKIAKEERERIEKLGYELITVEDCNYREKFNQDEYVRMIEEIWNDMPREELSAEDEILTPERYNNLIDIIIKRGNKLYGFIVVEKETNALVGLTKIFINKYQPEYAEQDDTGVISKHRGKGLGLALKYQMLEKMLKETRVKLWFTGNAQSNEHMIRINKILKHKELGRRNVYEFHKNEWKLF